jgi:hypothetical protein
MLIVDARYGYGTPWLGWCLDCQELSHGCFIGQRIMTNHGYRILYVYGGWHYHQSIFTMFRYDSPMVMVSL